MTETALVQACLGWLRRNGGDGYHVHGSGVQRAGEPDIDGWYPHPAGGVIHLKVEAKVGRNTPSKLQLARLERYKQAGYTTGVIYSLDEFIALVNRGARLHQRGPVRRLE